LAINPPRVGDFSSEEFPSVQELNPLVDGGWVELAQLSYVLFGFFPGWRLDVEPFQVTFCILVGDLPPKIQLSQWVRGQLSISVR
jgi:hypothetical protein